MPGSSRCPLQSLDLVWCVRSTAALLEANPEPSSSHRARQCLSSSLRAWNRRPHAVTLPFEESGTGPEALGMAPRFSFLRFPQPKSLWIPLLTLLDNLLLTVDHHSQPPRPPKDLPAAKHSPEHTWGPKGDPICEEPTCRFTPLSARQKGAPPGPRCGVLRPPAPPREAFNRFRSPAPRTH